MKAHAMGASVDVLKNVCMDVVRTNIELPDKIFESLPSCLASELFVGNCVMAEEKVGTIKNCWQILTLRRKPKGVSKNEHR